MSRNTNSLASEIGNKLKQMKLPPLPATPLISIIIANYNYARYIGEAIESVLAQTYQHFEIIVCDEGSTDDSRDVVSRYQETDSRLRLLCKENGGLASALNTAYAACRGEIVCLLDADDVFLPDKLEELVGAFRKSKTCGVCIHRISKIRRDGSTFSYPRPQFLIKGWVAAQALHNGARVKNLPPASGLAFRKTITDLLFPLSISLRGLADGYISHTAQFFTEICAVNKVLAKQRIHGDNITSSDGFTVATIRRFLEDARLATTLMKERLATAYGPRVASVLRIEDNAQYWSFLLALHVLTGDGSKEVCGIPLESVVQNIRPYRQRLLAQLLLALPPRLSLVALQAWTGQSAGTAMVARTARSFLRI